MERTEPALVPQWLKCAANVNGGGNNIHHSDVPSSLNSAKSRYVRSNSENDSSRFLGRNPSSNSRLGSFSNLSAKHPYSSFTRSHRDRNCDVVKDKSFSEGKWEQNSYDPLSSILSRRNEGNALSRSQSMVSRKTSEKQDLRNGISSQSTTNGVKNQAFEKDFPSLGTGEKHGVTGVRGIVSPRLSSSFKSLPIGNTGFLGGEKWTSALAEVPAALANNGIGHPSFQQSSARNLSSDSDVVNTLVRNMAEALSQPVEQAIAGTQLPDKKQRLEELAIKQSRQLVPMKPAMPKSLIKANGSFDKARQPKVAIRTHLSNQSCAGSVRTDSTSAPYVGKFLVLKPGRENTPAAVIKEASSSTGNSQINNASSPTASKAAALSLRPRSKVEPRSSQSLARSRIEFFNLMRKKSNSVTNRELLSAISSPSDKTSNGSDTAVSSLALENGSEVILNGCGHDIPQKTRSLSDDDIECNFAGHEAICPDEEEAAFLRSLGWEENCGEDEGLTEDEIKAFYEVYMSRRPSSKLVSNLTLSS